MRLVLIGFGNVGQGLAELLVEKREDLSDAFGFEPLVVGICDAVKGSCYGRDGIDLAVALDTVAGGGSLADLPSGCDWDALRMIEEADADTMVELTFTDIETGEPASTHVAAALERGLNVVTTNKGPLALHYHDLDSVAEDEDAQFLFEGTVLSGTPLFNLIGETLAGSDITEMRGILNGTTNYMLTRMAEGLAYDAALAEAQERGYAEAVPDADVLGWDALAKVTILANVVFGADLRPSDTPCEGITNITPEQIAEAKERGEQYKLIGRVWREGDTVQASVGPELVVGTHPLASVTGALNAVTITTDTLGDVTIVGPGAGRRETGYAVLIDLLHVWSTM
ncbi:MAG: homoserine dehydrogenase [Anaerolineae bacterium]